MDLCVLSIFVPKMQYIPILRTNTILFCFFLVHSTLTPPCSKFDIISMRLGKGTSTSSSNSASPSSPWLDCSSTVTSLHIRPLSLTYHKEWLLNGSHFCSAVHALRILKDVWSWGKLLSLHTTRNLFKFSYNNGKWVQVLGLLLQT